LSYTDPLGLDYSATRAGNTINVYARVVLYGGKAASQYRAKQWETWAENAWNKDNPQYKNCDVNFDFEFVGDPDSGLYITADGFWRFREADNFVKVNPSANHRSNVTANWLGDWEYDATPGTVAHEAGHLLHLEDRYFETGGSMRGHEGAMMSSGDKIIQQYIDKIIERKGINCSCD